jgi:GT2 family glycosyltransferase
MKIVYIAGMHRSGTSMIARLLNLSGVDLGPEIDLLPAKNENEEGFWENRNFLTLNTEMLQHLGGSWDRLPKFEPGWEKSEELAHFRLRAKRLIKLFSKSEVWGWKDPRNSVLFPFWKQFLPASKVIVCVRNPMDVYKSLHKRNNFSPPAAYQLWADYNQSILTSSDQNNRIITHYEAYFQNPYLELKRMLKFLEIEVPEAHLLQSINSMSLSLRHHQSRLAEMQMDAPAEIVELYQAMLAESGSTLLLDENTAYDRIDTTHLEQDTSDKPEEVIRILSLELLQKNQAIIENAQEIQTLKIKIIEMENSAVWKFAMLLRRFRIAIAPPNSRRLQLLRYATSAIAYPFKHFSHARELKNNTALIAASGLFSREWYLRIYPDVAQSGQDPLQHFLIHGGFEGRAPGPDFSSEWYLETYPDARLLGINPLVHYLRFGKQDNRDIAPAMSNKNFSQVMELLLEQPATSTLAEQTPIDILIPIYNGKQFLTPLLESILRNTTVPFRLIIANDKSTDPLIAKLLLAFKTNNPNNEIILVENKENLGFVRTINKLVAMTQNHFVILNSDTEVPPNWLERLMAPILADPMIASTTPFTNAGAISSFPNFIEDNPIFENLDVTTLDSFFQFVDFDKNFVEVPTGVGFCMGINKTVQQQIGMFDQIFGKGYGEENDWCMRAIHAGYKNIIVPNLFVYHKHGGSFNNNEKKILAEQNLDILKKIHPDYASLVADFVRKDPLRDLRNILKIKIQASLHPPRLVLDHTQEGRPSDFITTLVENEKLTVISTTMQRNYFLKFKGRNLEESTFTLDKNSQGIERVIQMLNISEIIINQIGGFPRPLELVDFIVKLKQNNQALKITYIVHDYFCVCPIYKLLDYQVKFCDVPADLQTCGKCLANNPLIKTLVPQVHIQHPNLPMSLWREKFGALLACSSEIICFSTSSRQILQKAYPGLQDDLFQFLAQDTALIKPVEIHKSTERLDIAILGNLTVAKGANVITSLASYIDYHNLDIKLHIFGETPEPFSNYELFKSTLKHGRYIEAELSGLMEENKIDLVLVPSIFPEPYSFTTEAAIKMHLPVAVFNMGAQLEHIRNYPSGISLTKQQPEYILQTITAALHKNFPSLPASIPGAVIVCVSNNEQIFSRDVLSSAYMTEHKIIKYDNIENNLPIPVRYNDAIENLLTSDYNGWIFFVHNDFSILEPLELITQGLNHNALYGPIGAILQNNRKVMQGQILQAHNSGLIYHGTKIKSPSLVDTLDCQCLIIHTDLLRKENLRFDTNNLLAFHQYVEDFCLNANVNHNIDTFAIPMRCKHLSWGKLNSSFHQAIKYINNKYPARQWAGTCTHLD